MTPQDKQPTIQEAALNEYPVKLERPEWKTRDEFYDANESDRNIWKAGAEWASLKLTEQSSKRSGWVRGAKRLPGLFTTVKWRNADGGNIPLPDATPLEHYQRAGPNINWHEWYDEFPSLLPCPECAGKEKEISVFNSLQNFHICTNSIQYNYGTVICSMCRGQEGINLMVEKDKFDRMKEYFQAKDKTISQLQEENKRLKGLIGEAWQQSIDNCEAENGAGEGEVKYVSWKDFKTNNNL